MAPILIDRGVHLSYPGEGIPTERGQVLDFLELQNASDRRSWFCVRVETGPIGPPLLGSLGDLLGGTGSPPQLSGAVVTNQSAPVDPDSGPPRSTFAAAPRLDTRFYSVELPLDPPVAPGEIVDVRLTVDAPAQFEEGEWLRLTFCSKDEDGTVIWPAGNPVPAEPPRPSPLQPLLNGASQAVKFAAADSSSAGGGELALAAIAAELRRTELGLREVSRRLLALEQNPALRAAELELDS